MTIDWELLRARDGKEDIILTLKNGLEITGDGSLAKAKEYLKEPLQIVNQRESLHKRHEQLLLALDECSRLL